MNLGICEGPISFYRIVDLLNLMKEINMFSKVDSRSKYTNCAFGTLIFPISLLDLKVVTMNFLSCFWGD